MTAESGPPEQFVGSYEGRILLALSIGWLLAQIAKLLLPPLLPTIIEDVGISLGTAGVLLTIIEASTALAQYPGGRLSDDLGRATLVIAGLGVMSLGLILFVGLPIYAVIVIGAALFGIGRGLYSVSSRTLISDLFVRRRGRALGAFTASYDTGGAIAAVIAVIVIGSLPWRTPFGVIAIGFAIFLAVFGILNREPMVVRRVEMQLTSTARRMVATPAQRGTLISFALFLFVALGFINFLPAYLLSKGFSTTLANSAYAIYFVVGILSKPVAGDLSDRFPRRTVATAALGMAFVLLSALVIVDTPIFVLGILFVFAITIKAQFPLIDAILLDTVEAESAGGDLGAAKALLFGFGSLGTAFAGVFAERFGYFVAFGGFALCLLVAMVVMSRLR